MAHLVLLLAVSLAACAYGQIEQGRTYSHRYDYVDVDAILGSKRLVRNYAECLLNLKPCSPEGKALRRILPEALRTKCAYCTESQKVGALKILKTLKSDYKSVWIRLIAKWDPTGDLTRRFEEYLEKERFNDIPNEYTRGPSTPFDNPATASSSFPFLLNRFGGSDEDTAASNSVVSTPSTVVSITPTTSPRTKATTASPKAPTPSVVTLDQWPQDNASSGDSSLTGQEVLPVTRLPPRPPIEQGPSNAVPEYAYPSSYDTTKRPAYKDTVSLIDLFGKKFIRTTELVTDLLKNTIESILGGLLSQCQTNKQNTNNCGN